MSLQYPTANDLELWFDIIQRNQEFGPYLPAIDDGWIDSIQSDLALCAMHPDGQRLSSASARLFIASLRIIISLTEQALGSIDVFHASGF